MYSLSEAAKATGKSKSTILRAVKSGKVTAQKDEHGQYQITPDELHRVYPVASGEAVREPHYDAPRNTHATPDEAAEISILQTKLEAAQQTISDRDRELSHRDRTIEDLRDRLDREGEERRKLTAMLTDQRQPPKGLWARLTGR